MLRGLRDSLLSAVYPQQCRVCSGTVQSLDDGVACSDCWNSTTIFDGSEVLCSKCGAFFSTKSAPVSIRCHKCDDHYYDRARAVGIYEKALSASIISLKSAPHLPAVLKSLVESAIERPGFEGYDAILPVPLAKLRNLERGFNQAEIVAGAVSRATGVRMDAHSMARTVHTPIHRVGMDDRARELTVQNAFKVVRPRLVSGNRLLLVDDVFTSGATASYCAKVLKRNGATQVDVFTLARAVMK